MSKKESENRDEIKDFIREKIQTDLRSGVIKRVVTRFPPEPNGFLHIGHAKSMGLNFGVAKEFNGECHLRFDDTNPTKEDQEFIEAICEDVRWLGYRWNGKVYYASDNFEKLYEYAVFLINLGKAYVDDLSAQEIQKYRGSLIEAGTESPFRKRSKEENLDLFKRMRAGEFEEGARVLRAKINMASGNINLRDPILYRILKANHPRTGGDWCIYPTYDFAHGQTDAIEGVTHSLCTLEFEDHRPLYDWLVDLLPLPCKPKQYEFSRLNLSYTVLSKRFLTQLIINRTVAGWDDPRMPTILGLRRRGVPPEAIRDFVSRLAITKTGGTVETVLLDHCIRNYLNEHAVRRMAVLNPVRVVIENYPESGSEEIEAENLPGNKSAGKRLIPFSRELYIEQEDFMEEPSKNFFRLAPGREVRLRYAYFITCKEVKRNEKGEITEIICSYDPLTKGGQSPDGRKVKGTLHWVSSQHSIPATVRLFEPLFVDEKIENKDRFENSLNPNSLTVLDNCYLEPALKEAKSEVPVQFERLGYFCVDAKDSKEQLAFNRTVSLRDTFKRKNIHQT